MFPSRWVLSAVVLLLGFSLAPYLHAQRGAITAPQNLVELTDRAEVIVRGMVLSARSEPHPQLTNLKTVLITVKVKETLKGAAPSLYTFRQFIWDMRDQFNTAGYSKGQELLLLMNKTSALGLTTPVGLEQGRFRIFRDSSGNRVALNGHGNAGLFAGMEAQLRQRKIAPAASASRMLQQTGGAVGAEELSRLVRQVVEKK